MIGNFDRTLLLNQNFLSSCNTTTTCKAIRERTTVCFCKPTQDFFPISSSTSLLSASPFSEQQFSYENYAF